MTSKIAKFILHSIYENEHNRVQKAQKFKPVQMIVAVNIAIHTTFGIKTKMTPA